MASLMPRQILAQLSRTKQARVEFHCRSRMWIDYTGCVNFKPSRTVQYMRQM